jgi:AcrR family transcriptional regulator
MARPRSEDKRNAILAAAAEVFAERGLGAPTSAISQTAGVAEGTLFTYFETKDELLNALYREIKQELASAMMKGFPRAKPIRQRLQHVWNQYVAWGVEHGTQHRALRQIQVWSGLTEESKAAGTAAFAEIQKLAVTAAVAQSTLDGLPQRYFAATMQALAETTMEFVRQDPKNGDVYREAGFKMLCAGIRFGRG